MRVLSISFLSAVAIIMSQHDVNAFSVLKTHHSVVTNKITPSSSALNVNLPRLDLPDVVSEKLEEYDLKNPNEMDAEEYNGYSGAAIGGTLLFFLIPGALLSGIFGAFGTLVTSLALNFVISALLGGGLLIYASLRTDEIGQTVRSNGNNLYEAIKGSGLPVVPRLAVPGVVDEKLEEFNLMSINDMEEEEYDGYSGAAVGGTLLFFVLSIFISGTLDTVTDEILPSIVTDLLVSALIGGGAAIYLSLRKDELGETVTGYGTKLLKAADEVFEPVGELSAKTETGSADVDRIVAEADEIAEEVRKTAGI